MIRMTRTIRTWATGALFLGCFAVGTLLPRVARPQSMAHDTAGHGLGMSATTGHYGRDRSALFLVDHNTRRLAIYTVVNAKDLRFVAARDTSYDLRLRGFRDRSNRRVDVRTLRELFRRQVGSGDVELDPKKRKRK